MADLLGIMFLTVNSPLSSPPSQPSSSLLFLSLPFLTSSFLFSRFYHSPPQNKAAPRTSSRALSWVNTSCPRPQSKPHVHAPPENQGAGGIHPEPPENGTAPDHHWPVSAEAWGARSLLGQLSPMPSTTTASTALVFAWLSVDFFSHILKIMGKIFFLPGPRSCSALGCCLLSISLKSFVLIPTHS